MTMSKMSELMPERRKYSKCMTTWNLTSNFNVFVYQWSLVHNHENGLWNYDLNPLLNYFKFMNQITTSFGNKSMIHPIKIIYNQLIMTQKTELKFFYKFAFLCKHCQTTLSQGCHEIHQRNSQGNYFHQPLVSQQLFLFFL